MPAYIVVQIEVTDPAVYDAYKLAAPATIALYGGRYIVRGGPVDVLEGVWKPKRLVVLEFPDKERARAWWESPEYGPAKAQRQLCARTEMILIGGV